MLTPDQVTAYTTALVFGCAAAYERFVNRKKTEKTEQERTALSEALMFKERGDLMLKQVEEYKDLLEKEYTAHQATRDFHHAQATIAQLKLSECNEKCQELQTRTDLTRVEEILIRQSTAMTQMASGIQELLKR